MSQDTILEMRAIDKVFPGVKALSKVDFKLKRGQVHALLGENGAGKSTLIKVITGAITPDSGAIIFKDKSYAHVRACPGMNSAA